jgi:hypothetical protein
MLGAVEADRAEEGRLEHPRLAAPDQLQDCQERGHDLVHGLAADVVPVDRLDGQRRSRR